MSDRSSASAACGVAVGRLAWRGFQHGSALPEQAAPGDSFDTTVFQLPGSLTGIFDGQRTASYKTTLRRWFIGVEGTGINRAAASRTCSRGALSPAGDDLQ